MNRAEIAATYTAQAEYLRRAAESTRRAAQLYKEARRKPIPITPVHTPFRPGGAPMWGRDMLGRATGGERQGILNTALRHLRIESGDSGN